MVCMSVMRGHHTQSTTPTPDTSIVKQRSRTNQLNSGRSKCQGRVFPHDQPPTLRPPQTAMGWRVGVALVAPLYGPPRPGRTTARKGLTRCQTTTYVKGAYRGPPVGSGRSWGILERLRAAHERGHSRCLFGGGRDPLGPPDCPPPERADPRTRAPRNPETHAPQFFYIPRSCLPTPCGPSGISPGPAA